MTEAILATVDAMEAERGGEPRGRLGFGGHPEEFYTDLDMVRAFVKTSIYHAVIEDYLRGEGDSPFLCQVVELLHELAPRSFRSPRY